MKTKGFHRWVLGAVALAATGFFGLAIGAAPCVDITAELEIKDWHYFHSCVGIMQDSADPIKNEGLFQPADTVHCVVGGQATSG